MCIFPCPLSGFGVVSQGGERGRAVAALILLGMGSPVRADNGRGGIRSGTAAAGRFSVSAVKWVSKK